MEWKQKNKSKNKSDLVGARKNNIFKIKKNQKNTSLLDGKHSNRPTYNESRMTLDKEDVHLYKKGAKYDLWK